MRIYRNKNKVISVGKSVQKFVATLSPQRREQITKAITQLPDGEHIAKLYGVKNRYRIRVGGIRIIFDKVDEGDILKIFVVNIGNRGDVYKS